MTAIVVFSTGYFIAVDFFFVGFYKNVRNRYNIILLETIERNCHIFNIIERNCHIFNLL